MRKLEEYRSKAKELGRRLFLAHHSEPVFVPSKILTGSLHAAQFGVRNATMVHYDEEAVVNPLKVSRAVKLGTDAMRHRLRNGLTIGREASCAVTIADYTISKQHARWRPGHFPKPATIEDTGSSNGTWINGERLKTNVPSPVNSGDTVRFGRMVVDYYSAKDFFELLMTDKL